MKQERLKAKDVLLQLGVYLVLTALTLVLLSDQLGSVRREFRVKATLQLLFEGMQGYYADKESYVKMSPAPAAAVVQILLATGHLKQAPLNPYTGRVYTAEDAEDDKIFYEAAPDFKSFKLSAEKPKSKDIWLAMESK